MALFDLDIAKKANDTLGILKE
nr:hypothetical protein [Methanocaldococcus villosus]